jgi:Sulfatase-modifying factor enzyme 1
MKIRILSITILSLIILVSCYSQKSLKQQNWENLQTPPGTIKISENTFVDQTEITNISYKEYMAYIRMNYGTQSKEYKSTLLDTTVWRMLSPHYAYLDTIYYKSPVFDEYPLVGISYQQAVEYTRWRSDRVMEAFLVGRGVLQSGMAKNPTEIFTIEKYFRGQHKGIKPDPSFPYYPEYTLMDSTTYIQAMTYALRHNAAAFEKCKDIPCIKNNPIGDNCLEHKKNVSKKYPYGTMPTVIAYCSECKQAFFMHLSGNVREMTIDSNIFFGKSFKDNCSKPNNICIRDTNQVNCFTGFRNKCTYKNWAF